MMRPHHWNTSRHRLAGSFKSAPSRRCHRSMAGGPLSGSPDTRGLSSSSAGLVGKPNWARVSFTDIMMDRGMNRSSTKLSTFRNSRVRYFTIVSITFGAILSPKPIPAIEYFLPSYTTTWYFSRLGSSLSCRYALQISSTTLSASRWCHSQSFWSVASTSAPGLDLIKCFRLRCTGVVLLCYRLTAISGRIGPGKRCCSSSYTTSQPLLIPCAPPHGTLSLHSETTVS